MTKSDVILLDSSRKIALNSGTNVRLNEVLSSDEWELLKAGTPIESHLNAPESILIGKPVMSNGHFNGAVLMLSSTQDIQSSISHS
ncbi:hypothetical protein [Aneurinibacillus tyrosinisolvens]|uniref:hypothetical protein n=1 Tax=Aneurinibacillus tyrosinisolvens TaxID=1443435 RepID=UPI00063F0077|nr:hypothetical protein [Aneurinibacillus tyrosinisolvens]